MIASRHAALASWRRLPNMKAPERGDDRSAFPDSFVIHADGYGSAGHIYLIPASFPADAAHGYSLIRLIETGDEGTGSHGAELRHMLTDGRRVSGCFVIVPGAFNSEGTLAARLIEIRHIEVRTRSQRPGACSLRFAGVAAHIAKRLIQTLVTLVAARIPGRPVGPGGKIDDI